jgi:asparagine synthase (glutamine-hydrolysing)
VEGRHPFFDLRLLRFLMALPTLPWCSDKEILREAGRNILPDAVRVRRKSPLLGEPLVALLRRPESAWVDRFEQLPLLADYVARHRISSMLDREGAWTSWIHLRPLSLNFWLRALYPPAINAKGGTDRELNSTTIAQSTRSAKESLSDTHPKDIRKDRVVDRGVN